MLLDRYDLSGEGSVIRNDEPLLGDRIDSRKAFFTKLQRHSGGAKKRNLSGGSYRRGNSFSNQGFSQRVVVKAHFRRHNSGSAGAGNLRGHLGYITRDGAGINEERPELFGNVEGVENDLSRSEFYNKCKGDRHHFRLIISPENGHRIDDFEGYITRVMSRVEEDLETKLEWVSAVHYDTDNPHAHVVLRGRDDKGKDLVIAPDYISFGIRGVAQEIVTEILGERSLGELQRGMEEEVGVLRVTSLDRFIERRGIEVEAEEGAVSEIKVNVRELGRNPRDAFYDDLVKKRLAFLATTSMARELSKDIYHVRSNFMGELKEVSEKNDIIKQLYRSMPDEEQGVTVYKIENGEGTVICGSVEKVAHVNELTDHKYMVVRDHSDELHYVPLSLNDRHESIREGAIVEVSAGEKSTLKADRAILEIASENAGIYSREAHLTHVVKHMKFIKEPKTYVDYHGKRIKALEDAGIIEAVENGGYKVPEDVTLRGDVLSIEQDKKHPKRQYAHVKSLSVVPIVDKFSIYDVDDDNAPIIQGRIEKLDLINSQGVKKYMLVRDGNEQAHYVPLSMLDRNKALCVGAIVEVSAGKPKGGADYNIDKMASENDGIYRREDHLAFVHKSKKDMDDPGAYVDNHVIRLQTLEKAGIVEALEGGSYKVPEDVIDRGTALNAELEAKEKKRGVAQVKVISSMPLESQVDANARTFLDLEIYRHQKDYKLAYGNADKGTLEAIYKRQDWLEENGYGYHNEDDGAFVMKGDALGKLYDAEVTRVGANLVKGFGVKDYRHIELNSNASIDVTYVGYVDMHSGHHIVVKNEGYISLVKSKSSSVKWLVNETVRIENGEKGMSIQRNILNKAKEEALEDLSQKLGMEYKELNLDEQHQVNYIGGLHLKDGAYAAVSHEDKISLVKVEQYPVYDYDQELELSVEKGGFIEIREAEIQRELELEKDEFKIEVETQNIRRNEPKIEIDDDWWD